MSRRVAILAIAVPLAACGSSSATTTHTAAVTAAATAATPARCGPPAARTLASSRVARVYEQQQIVYGCSSKRGKPYRLGAQRPCLSVPCVALPRVVSELVAYASIHRGVDTGFTDVVVKRLTDAKTLLDQSATLKSSGPESFQSVNDLVLKKDGAVAWIGQSVSIIRPASKDVEVVKRDRGGTKLLDSGTGIRSGSLRLVGSTLSWTDGSVTRSATLS